MAFAVESGLPLARNPVLARMGKKETAASVRYGLEWA
jgi:hypothetical protein